MSINTNSTETPIDNDIDIDSTVWKTVTRNRCCSNSKCGLAYEDNIFVPAGKWVIDTTPEPGELQICPKCGNKFAVKFTTSDTKFYPSNPAPKREGKYRELTIDGKCSCGSKQGYDKEEWHSKSGDNVTWTPKNHMQPCPDCGNKYWIYWTEEENDLSLA